MHCLQRIADHLHLGLGFGLVYILRIWIGLFPSGGPPINKGMCSLHSLSSPQSLQRHLQVRSKGNFFWKATSQKLWYLLWGRLLLLWWFSWIFRMPNGVFFGRTMRLTICLYGLLTVNLVLDPAEGLIFELQVLILTVWVYSLPFSTTWWDFDP